MKQIKLFLVGLCCTSFAAQVLATQNDDAFADYINDEICATPSGDLIVTCAAATTTIGGSGETLPQTGNTGMQGANELSARQKIKQTSTSEEQSTQGRQQFQNLGVFGSFEYQNLDRDTTDLENGYQGDGNVATIGADYRFNSQYLFGLALSMQQAEMELRQSAGEIETDSQEWVAFANYRFNDWLYLDGYVGQSRQENKAIRAVSFGLIQYESVSDFDSQNSQWGLGVGATSAYNSLAMDWMLRYEQSRLEMDAYAEQGGDSIENLNLMFPDQTVDSKKFIASFVSAMNISTGSGVWVPYARVEIAHEMETDGRSIDTYLVLAPDADAFVIATDEADSLYGSLGIGVQGIMAGGIMVYTDVESLVSHQLYDSWKWSLGFRLEL